MVNPFGAVAETAESLSSDSHLGFERAANWIELISTDSGQGSIDE